MTITNLQKKYIPLWRRGFGVAMALVIPSLLAILSSGATDNLSPAAGDSSRAAGPASAAESAPPPSTRALTAESGVDDILDALDARGRDLRDFSATVKMRDEDFTGDSTEHDGTVLFWNNADNPRFRITFNRLIQGEKIRTQNHVYTLDGGVLTERDESVHKVIRRQVAREGEKVNLLKLGSGPFPMPIGQKKEDVKQLFAVEHIAADKDDPPATVHVRLTPIKGTPYARQFKAVDVWVDLQTNMPVRISTDDAAGSITKVTDLGAIRINPGLSDKDFAEPPLPPGWDLVQEDYK